MEPTSEESPLRAKGPTSYVPAGVALAFGSTYFLISTLIASIIPILQLAVGWYYNGQCPIQQKIPTYLIVSGVCGLALVALSVLMALTFILFLPNSTVLSVVASCGICCNLIATFILSLFVFVWFIIGCVWIFGVKKRVQYDHHFLETYCQPVLYNVAFWLLIVTFIMFFISCCMSCFRTRKQQTQTA